MKLTKYDKQVIVRAILADIPFDNDKVRKDAQAALVKAMTPTVRKVYQLHPRALNTHYYGCTIFTRESARFTVGDVDHEEVLKPFVEAKANYDRVVGNLKNTIESCSTLKQLQERLPEFAKYFPKEGEATPNLPAVANLVADLVKLGWKGAAQ